MSGRPRSLVSWIAFVVGTLVCLGVAYASFTLAGYSWAQVVGYRSPYVSSAVPAELRSIEATPGPALARQVVLLIVDGMRDDVSRANMPTLNTLRSYGSDVTITVPQPSLSRPNWTTILTGATPTISGVTTNWYSGRVLAPTIVDVARTSGRRVAVVGPTEFEELYGIAPGPAVSLRPWPKDGYLSSVLVDDALRIDKATDPQLLVVHLPDLDEAGHAHGGLSPQYRETAGKVDADISRLVTGLQADRTTFVVVTDHGHVATGGHGGWEPEVLNVPGIFSGSAVVLGTTSGTLEQVAPTVSALLGIRVPPYAETTALRSVISTTAEDVFASGEAHDRAFDEHYVNVVGGEMPELFKQGVVEYSSPSGYADYVRDTRLAVERQARLPISLAIFAAVAAVIVVIGLTSWRALVAALAGTAAYHMGYGGLFFGMHNYQWSLSAINTETQVQAFMSTRMAEAAVCVLIGVAIAALVYPMLRTIGWGPQHHGYLAGWLALAPATLLVVLGTLAVQVAWFLWLSGPSVMWLLPDFKWAFKYDLDLVQMTAVGASALLAPIVSYLIGRYHPRVRARRVAG